MKPRMRCWSSLGSLLVMVVVTASQAEVGIPQGLISPNLATKQELAALPHANPVWVERVLAERPFLDMLAFNALLADSASQLVAAQREDLYRRVFVPMNLNTASREEILLIPGVGPKMAHEFDEYRPYESLAQFRREIGKYVDDEEVLRLQQYVFVPVDLNTASDADILSIPGLGQRMLHEFKEYRPYLNIEQFRREIGKYVDKKELARLERYVTISYTEPSVD